MSFDDGLPTPRRYWAMLAIGIGIAMSVLDGSVVNVALPAMARELHASPGTAVWIVNGYQLATVVTLLPLAALGERVGYRRVFGGGVALFTAGSLACALSPSLPLLVSARVIQGLGAAGIMSVNGALVRFTYPKALLGRGVGLNALVVSLAAAVGPTLASVVLAVGSWPWLFAINLPLGLINLVLATRALPQSARNPEGLDWTSAALNAVAFGAVFIGGDAFAHAQGSAWLGAAMLLLGLGVGGMLVRREWGEARPLIPVDLMRGRVFALSVVASVCAFSAYMLAFLALPFQFEATLHRSQVETGLLMTPWPVALGLMAPLAGRLSDRFPAAVLGAVGMGLLCCGLVLLALMPPGASDLDIVWRVALAGLGFGLFQAPNNRTLLSSAPRERTGAAGGMLATARLTGMTSGATMTALAFHLSPRTAEPLSLWLGAGLALLAAAASLSRRRPKSGDQTPFEAPGSARPASAPA